MDNILTVGDKCSGCGTCAAVCPNKAIRLEKDACGFIYPEVSTELCIRCGVCLDNCLSASSIEEHTRQLSDSRILYSYSRNDTVRRRSSSGGLFTHIANAVDDAVIIGAEYSRAEGTLAHRVGELSALRRSKYAQSDMSEAEKLIREARTAGKSVVFCGTPCQAAAVRNLHPNDSDITVVDFVCHGVPSVRFLNEHIAHIEKTTRKRVEDVNFRSKSAGWSRQGMLYYFSDGTKRYIPYMLDAYMFGFMKSIILRKSCYTCPYIGRSKADITLADFWGVFDYAPKLNDEKGLSLVFLNTPLGERIFSRLGNETVSNELDKKAVEYVFKERDRSDRLKQREKFIKRYEKYGFERAIRKFFIIPSIKARLRERIKSFIK